MDALLYELLASGTLLLTSSRRLAHALRVEYAIAAQARGQSVWQTPQVMPWATYLRDACFAHRSNDNASLRFLNDAQALAIWEDIIGASVVGQNLLNPAQAARAASRSWQRLHQYLIPLAQLSNYPSEEAQTFVGWAQTFSERTQARGWIDSDRLATLLRSRQTVLPPRVALAGFDQLTPEARALIVHWRSLGCEVVNIEAEGNVGIVQVVAARDTDSELEDAARWARAQREAGRDRIAIVVSNLASRVATVRRVFEDAFSPDERRSGAQSDVQLFDIAASTSLARYPLVHSALLVLRIAQGNADYKVAGQLLRTPFITGSETEMAERALADVRLRDERRDKWDLAVLERWAGANRCPELAQNARAALQGLIARDAALPSIWSERFSLILKGLGWCQAGLQNRTLTSNEQQTRRKFYEVLTALGALDEVIGRISFSSALSRLRELLIHERFSPETSDRPITIIDPDTVAGMHFDVAWVTGLEANEWPAAPEPDAFIPIELQRKHGIPEASAETCLATARRKLQRLVASASNVVLSWPQRDDDAELRISPLLAAWHSVNPDELPRSAIVASAQRQFATRPPLDLVEDIQAPVLAAGQAKGGARTLELQSRCPFRAQAELRLNAIPLDTVTPGVRADERGTLVHRVLANVWAVIDSSDALQALSDEQLQQRIAAIVEREAVKILPATTTHAARLVALEVRAVTQWVMALLQVERQRPPFRVHRAEQSEPFEIAGLSVRIQPDRMDVLSNGRLLLIDYKTGAAYKPSQWLDGAHPGRPASPQLPLYAIAHADALAALAFVIVAPGVAEYRGLCDEFSTLPGVQAYAESKRLQLYGVETWGALIHHWREVLSALSHSYQAGESEVDPLYGECRYCDLSTLCRVSERISAAAEDDGDG